MKCRLLFSVVFLLFTGEIYASLAKGASPVPDNLSKALWEASGGPFAADSVVKAQEDMYFWLFRGQSIGQFDLDSRENLGGWSLNSHPVLILASEQLQAGERLHSAGVMSNYNEFSDPKAPLSLSDSRIWKTKDIGCLESHPLRYGDLTGDGKNDLVVFYNGRLSISSPERRQEIFTSLWHHRDEVSDPVMQDIENNQGEEHSAWYVRGYYMQGENAPQYVAGSGLDKHATELLPAMRAFAKHYFADFNDDGKPDIVVWRKVFVSNTVSEPPGFHLEAQNWLHYEKKDGVYGYVETDPGTVRGWLTADELTWQKGFPSHSECEGEEGDLIPEMHAPLLNDPEVLQ